MAAGVSPPGKSVGHLSEGDRAMLLDRAVAEYTSKGWQLDDRSDVYAIVSKEWGPGYIVLPFVQAIVAIFTFGLVDLGSQWQSKGRWRKAMRLEIIGEDWPPGDKFKRRSIHVSRTGAVTIVRAPTRGTSASRYDRNRPD
jgi:hypothetical protein